MQKVLYAAPTLQPVSLDDVKLHLRIEVNLTADDEYLESIIGAAVEHVEDVTNRRLLTQTWDYYLDAWPCANYITMPFGNLQSITSISWKDTDGTEATLTVTDDYLVETNGDQHGRIVLPYGETWPSSVLYPSNPIKIRFICGWTTAALVPSRIKSVIKLICGDLYENREWSLVGQPGQKYEVNPRFDDFLINLRLWK
jgi:uncharacterized phiE125 gp8 family phage protein